jgi:hypothetical protein
MVWQMILTGKPACWLHLATAGRSPMRLPNWSTIRPWLPMGLQGRQRIFDHYANADGGAERALLPTGGWELAPIAFCIDNTL